MDVIQLGFTIDEALKKGFVSECELEPLRHWQSTTGLPRLTDEQLVIFLASSDNNVDKAKNVVRVYFKHRMSGAAIFNDRNVANMGGVLNLVNNAVMPEKFDNCSLFVSFLNDSNYRNFDYENTLKLNCMVLESIAFENASPSVIIIFDCRNVGFMHLFKIKMALTFAFMDYIQHGIPVKTKKIHILNANGAIYSIYGMWKHLIRSDLLNKVVFHCDGFDEFHKNGIPKQYLPKELGGDLSSIYHYKTMTVKKLEKMQSYFDAEERQRKR